MSTWGGGGGLGMLGAYEWKKAGSFCRTLTVIFINKSRKSDEFAGAAKESTFFFHLTALDHVTPFRSYFTPLQSTTKSGQR